MDDDGGGPIFGQKGHRVELLAESDRINDLDKKTQMVEGNGVRHKICCVESTSEYASSLMHNYLLLSGGRKNPARHISPWV